MSKSFEQIVQEKTKWGSYLVENGVNTLRGRVSEDVIKDIVQLWKKLSDHEKVLLAQVMGGRYNLGLTLALIDGLQEELS